MAKNQTLKINYKQIVFHVKRKQTSKNPVRDPKLRLSIYNRNLITQQS